MKHSFKLLAGLVCLLFSFNVFAGAPEYGKASYYNDKFEGKNTASGEKYQKALFTCAHKTHKFGTMLRVTRVDNGESVDVRVNDRGPYGEGHVVDVSRAAAEAIGLIKAGVLKVKVEVIEPNTPAPATTAPKATEKGQTSAPAIERTKPITLPTESSSNSKTKPTLMPELVSKPGTATTATNNNSKAAPATTTKEAPKAAPVAKPISMLQNATYKVDMSKMEQKGFAVQLHSFSNADAALSELSKLQNTYKGQTILQTLSDGSCKILIGPFKDRKEADKFQKTAAKKGYPKCYIVNLEQD